MTPRDMIAEWRKGCSCAPAERPEECQECTRGLIEALDRALSTQERADAILRGLSGAERSCLLYLETCAVDRGGLAEGVRMNKEDFDAVTKFKNLEPPVLKFGRIPSDLLEPPRGLAGAQDTHWVELTPLGWVLAHECRRLRAQQRGPRATAVFERRGGA